MEQPNGGKGKLIAISGAGGGLGHLGVQFAAKLGCEVVAVDANNGALSLLKDVVAGLGAEVASRVHIVDARHSTPEEARTNICGAPESGLDGEKGCDAVIILPEGQQALDYGVKLLRNHSTCVVVSFPKEGFHIQASDLVFRHIKMAGVLVGRNRQVRAMLKFAAENDVRAKTRTYPLEKLNDLVEDYHKGAGGKLIVDLQASA